MKIFLLVVIFLFSILVFNCIAQQPGWEIIPSGTTEELNSIYFYDYQTGYACGNSGVVIKSVDSGKTWQSLQSPVSSNLNDIFVFPQECFIAVGDSATVINTWDGGDTMYVFHLLEYTKDIYSVSFSGDQGVFIDIFGASSQTIIKGVTTNCATVVLDVFGGLSDGGFWGAIMISPLIGFVVGENSIFQPILGRTTDSGVSWEFVSFYLNGNEGRATGVDFTDQLTGYISARVWNGQGAIAKTTDSGDSWTTTIFNNPLWGIDFPISGASQVGYCVGDSGTILKTYNAGDIWFPQVSGTSEKLNKVHFLDLDFGFAVGENGTILRTTTGGETVTQVSANSLQAFDFKLDQNYPNPFNPTTTIKFTIPQSVILSGAKNLIYVQLKVYDVLGSEVATVINEEKPAGNYEVEFNANELPSGIYFYKLRAGNYVETKKMLLLK